MFLTNKKNLFCLNFQKKFNIKINNIKINNFPDSELYIKIKNIKKKKINLIFNFYGNYNIRLIELLMILDIIKNNRSKVVLIIPYLPYSRQDKEQCKITPAKFISKLINFNEIERIITFDLHSDYIKLLYKCEFVNIRTDNIIKKIIDRKTIVFPDIGSFKRFYNLKKYNKIIFEKNRKNNKINIKPLFKNKKIKKVIIIDDIIDSGKTFEKIYDFLIKIKVEKIFSYFTHALLRDEKFFLKKKIKRIYFSDSLEFPCKNMKIMKLCELIDERFLL
ncbi:ribose-phosphate diphosphokinase [Candidatus Vidania fulgoroideorum]